MSHPRVRFGGKEVAGRRLEELQHGRVLEGRRVRHIDDHMPAEHPNAIGAGARGPVYWTMVSVDTSLSVVRDDEGSRSNRPLNGGDLGMADELIEEKEIDWGLTKRSFLLLRQKYPDSFEIESLFAVLSRHARDRAQARLRMESIGNRVDRGVWRSERQFRSARKWALSKR